jgi:hypothetical protein
VAPNIDDAVWDPAAFTKIRDELLDAEVSNSFFAEVLPEARRRGGRL